MKAYVKSILLTLSCTSLVMAQAAVNAAGGGSAVAAGSLISIYGSFSGVHTGTATSFPLPTTAGSAYLLYYSGTGPINDVASNRVPLLYWSDSQINAYLTQSNPGQQIVVWGIKNTGTLGPLAILPLDLQAQAPGIFLNGEWGSIAEGTGALITTTNPAIPGQGLVIWCTGLGTIPSAPIVTVSAPGGTSVTASVFYSGHQGALVGLDQVNFYVPNAAMLLGSSCSVGARLNLQISMKSVTSGVVSNTVAMPILVNSCK